MEDYIKCELIGGGSPRHLNPASNLFIVAAHHTLMTHANALLLMLTVPMCTMQSMTK